MTRFGSTRATSYRPVPPNIVVLRAPNVGDGKLTMSVITISKGSLSVDKTLVNSVLRYVKGSSG